MNPIEDGGYIGSEDDRVEEDEETTNHLRDRFRLSTFSIAQSEAKQKNMEISQSIFVCVSDLAFKFADATPAVARQSITCAITLFRRVIVLVKSLSTIATKRPAFYGRILPVLLGLDPANCTVKVGRVSGVHHALKNAFLSCLRCTHPVAAPGMGQDNHLSSSCSKLSIRVSILLPSPRNSREARDVHSTY